MITRFELHAVGKRRKALADQVKAIHDDCSVASRELCEHAFTLYANTNTSLADLARCAAMDADDFRSLMYKYIGKEKIQEARKNRR